MGDERTRGRTAGATSDGTRRTLDVWMERQGGGLRRGRRGGLGRVSVRGRRLRVGDLRVHGRVKPEPAHSGGAGGAAKRARRPLLPNLSRRHHWRGLACRETNSAAARRAHVGANNRAAPRGWERVGRQTCIETRSLPGLDDDDDDDDNRVQPPSPLSAATQDDGLFARVGVCLA